MGAILVFDVTNKASFDALGEWFEDINHYLPEVPKIVVGNKLDLDKNRAISTNEGQVCAPFPPLHPVIYMFPTAFI